MMARTAVSSRANARRTSSVSPDSTGAVCGIWAWRMMSTNNRVLGLDAAAGKRFPKYFGFVAAVGWAEARLRRTHHLSNSRRQRWARFALPTLHVRYAAGT